MQALGFRFLQCRYAKCLCFPQGVEREFSVCADEQKYKALKNTKYDHIPATIVPEKIVSNPDPKPTFKARNLHTLSDLCVMGKLMSVVDLLKLDLLSMIVQIKWTPFLRQIALYNQAVPEITHSEREGNTLSIVTKNVQIR
ncbi:hypothetical protein RCL_jg21754.t1 [Rhizophagus clarus]|uniref:Uncharacterized protein n=1 Tax=Rhizophagus clarus TaxID=94130 RepID=A0A8H3L2B4_9GLOM|nr:hypothetical protein RCL_jg21754.t1 [Rhizophagus clarus]